MPKTNFLPFQDIIRYDGNGGWGGTNTHVRYFTNLLDQVGDSMTILNNDSTFGLEIQILKSGIYCVSTICAQTNLAGNYYGVSRNSTELTSNIQDIDADDRIAMALKSTSGGTQGTGAACNTLYLEAGDIIRAHGDAQGINFWAMFSISRVG
jgi:hypothetical protein